MWRTTWKKYSVPLTPLQNKWSSFCSRLSFRHRAWSVLLNKRWICLHVTVLLQPLKYHYLQGREVNLSNTAWIHREGWHKWTHWALLLRDCHCGYAEPCTLHIRLNAWLSRAGSISASTFLNRMPILPSIYFNLLRLEGTLWKCSLKPEQNLSTVKMLSIIFFLKNLNVF